MSGVLELVDLSSLGLGDDAICQLDSYPAGEWSCARPAAWAATVPCGVQFLACEQHHETILLAQTIGCACAADRHWCREVRWRRA